MYKKVCDVSRRLVAISLVILLAVPAIRADSEQIDPEDSVTIAEEIKPQTPPGDSEEEPRALESEKSLDLEEDVTQEEQQEELTEPVFQDAGAPEVTTEDSPQEEKKDEGEAPKEPVEDEGFFKQCRDEFLEYCNAVACFVKEHKKGSIITGVVTVVALLLCTIPAFVRAKGFLKVVEGDGYKEYYDDEHGFWWAFFHPVKSWSWLLTAKKHWLPTRK